MSNLGSYQTEVTLSKKVGGPMILALLVGSGGYIILRGAEIGVKAIIKSIQFAKQKRKEHIFEYQVKHQAVNEQGLELIPGDTIRILEYDGNAVLIEKDGAGNNPYIVSADFLIRVLDL